MIPKLFPLSSEIPEITALQRFNEAFLNLKFRFPSMMVLEFTKVFCNRRYCEFYCFINIYAYFKLKITLK